MVLELIVIGGVIYYYVRKNKQEKAKNRALAAGQPWTNKDGSVTYPAGYAGLPPYTPAGDYKRQTPVEEQRSVLPTYTDAPMNSTTSVSIQDEKRGPMAVETREVNFERDEKRSMDKM